MTRISLFRRYVIFFLGIFAAALGVSLMTKAGLGTSPVTSLAYVLTFVFPISLGTFSFLVNGVMLVAQVAILRRDFQKIQYLQLAATLVFSACIDLTMWMLRIFSPASYAGQMVTLLIGCVFLGLGVSLEVAADVLILPGEGIVKVIAVKLGKEFGIVKTVFDIFLVVSASILSIACTGTINGIREGTVISAMTVGMITRFFRAHLPVLTAMESPAALEPIKDIVS